jgi:uroporphyrin-3 C-methyltransferase
MADSSPPELPPKSALPDGPAERKRVHSYSRLTTAIAVLALATAGYALWRLDSTRERLDQVNDLAHTLAADRTALQTELRALAERESQRAKDLAERIDALNALPKEMQALSTAVDELHSRTEGPQRAWSRAEALFLMEIAQRSLILDRDAATAIAALESADARLASVRDPALTSVRQQLALELQALRALQPLDRTGLLTRLAALEGEATRLPVEGIVAVERERPSREELPNGWFARARAMVANALTNLIRVREIDKRGGRVVTADEQLIRKQHLQLLLFSARTAVIRHDTATYRSSLAAARQWLGEFFDIDTPAARNMLAEIQALEAIEIDPPLPDISKSAESLQRLTLRSGA